MFTEATADLPPWMAAALIALLFVALIGLLYHFRHRTPVLTMVVESHGAQMLHNLRGVIEHYSDGSESHMRLMPNCYVHEFVTNLIKIGHRPGDPAPGEEAATLEKVEIFALDLDETFSWGIEGMRAPTMLMKWVKIHQLVPQPHEHETPEATKTSAAEEPVATASATS